MADPNFRNDAKPRQEQFQWLAIGLAVAPLVKFALVSLVSVPATFFVSHWIRKPLKL